MGKRIIWWYFGPCGVVVFFVLDRYTKWYFSSHSQAVYSMLNNIIRLQYHLNTEMALSLPLLPGVYYPLVTVVFCVLVFILYTAVKKRRLGEFIPITLIVFGAISNLIDRIIYHGVVDFINISIGNIFNLADVYIICGVMAWFLFTICYDRKKLLRNHHG